VGDLYEFNLALDLRDDLTEAELADLRFHLTPGPERDYAADESEWAPEPLLAGTGPAYRIGGSLFAVLERRRREPGWALTARQEVHAESIDDLRDLVLRLVRHSAYPYCNIGHLRFFEDEQPEALVVREGGLDWP
jgi:hypothetical protein